MNELLPTPPNTPTPITPMAAVGQVANQTAADYVFEEYVNRKSDYTIATQRAALQRFADYPYAHIGRAAFRRLSLRPCL